MRARSSSSDGQPAPAAGLDGVAGFVEEPRFYPYLSARQTLTLLRASSTAAAPRPVDELLDLVGLDRRRPTGASADTRPGCASGSDWRARCSRPAPAPARRADDRSRSDRASEMRDAPPSARGRRRRRAPQQPRHGRGGRHLRHRHVSLVGTSRLGRLDGAPARGGAGGGVPTRDERRREGARSERVTCRASGAERRSGAGCSSRPSATRSTRLVLALADEGIAVRRLAEVASSVEAMFRALTGGRHRERSGGDGLRPGRRAGRAGRRSGP